MNLLKKWWFWIIVAILLFVFFFPKSHYYIEESNIPGEDWIYEKVCSCFGYKIPYYSGTDPASAVPGDMSYNRWDDRYNGKCFGLPLFCKCSKSTLYYEPSVRIIKETVKCKE